MLTFIGVCVSPSAKNARARMFTDGKHHKSRREAHQRERRVVGGVGGELSPRSKSSRTIGSASATSRTAAIKFRKISVASPCRSVERNSDSFYPPPAGERRQQIVASEMPNMPCGSSISRTASLNDATIRVDPEGDACTSATLI